MSQLSEGPTGLDHAAVSRRTLIAGAGGILGAAVIARAATPAHAAPGGGLNGIGLTRTDFTAKYGNPVVGQGASVYQVAGNSFYVTNTASVQTDRVVSVYWTGDPQPRDAVRGRLAQFLPDDAVLTDIGEAPAAGVGPRLRVDTYNSSAVGSALAGSGFVDSGDMLLAYGYTGDLSGVVSWANLYVGVKP